MSIAQPQRKKLIEVALPLDEINVACKADKDRKTGTLRNLHKWFAPMPLPAWRALLFAALIDDPEDDERRAFLLDLTKRLVANGADLPNEQVVAEAQELIKAQFPGGAPVVMDPFCGGGSTLAEAQRLGLDTFGSDLNPVPALISRTLTELLPQVYGGSPLAPASELASGDIDGFLDRAQYQSVAGYNGLARDVRRYATWVADEVQLRLGEHYRLTAGERPVAWLWARTAGCPNPACGVETILASTWWLSKRAGQLAWIEPRLQGGRIELEIVSDRAHGAPGVEAKAGRGAFACAACGSALDSNYLRTEGRAGRLGLRMTAVVSEGPGRKRLYRVPTQSDLDAAAEVSVPEGIADIPVAEWRSVNVPYYGLTSWADIYTARQLAALSAFAEATSRVRQRILDDGGSEAWALAIASLLGLAVGKLAHGSSTQSRWKFDSRSGTAKAEAAFGRNDLPMTWDFAEVYPFGNGAMSWQQCIDTMLDALPYVPRGTGRVVRADARTSKPGSPVMVATDPPYFDAIGYADLSDYFYVWHRLALRGVHPDLYATVAAPKQGELTALPLHHEGSKDAARDYFIDGFSATFRNLQESMAEGLPMLVVYASKEQGGSGDEGTRWSSILTAMIQANLEITGTWPIHGTGSSRMIGQGANAVATYVVMVCRPRPVGAGSCSLGDFNRALRRELKPAVHQLQAAGTLPVDLAQAAMGPGMQVYSRYERIVDQAGRTVPVGQALRLINAALGEVLDEQEGELDPYSRFAIAWWERNGWNAAAFGEADQLARPQGIGVDDLIRAGVARYPRPGFVEVLGAGSLDRNWLPGADSHPTAWEAVHHLADRLIDGDGTSEASRLMADIGTLRDPAQALVYRLHDIAVKKARTKDQERYNALIGSWSDLIAMSATVKDGLF